MTDHQELTGPALAAAVAWLMMPEPKGDGDVLLRDGTCYVIWDMEGDMDEWRPDLGGADAWAVLEWVHDIAHAVSLMRTTSPDGQHTHWIDLHTPPMVASGRGKTDAIALCRAVVAMGAAE